MRRKTLYLSDLDGTLLMPDASLSPFSRQCLNELIRQGLSFSCATARTAASAVPILDGLFLPLPVILLNGSCLFDLRTKRYEAVHYLHADAFATLLSLCRESGIHGFFHTIENDTLCTYYTKTDTPIAAAYMQDRIKRYHKRFIPLSDPAEIPNTHAVVYFTYTNTAQKLDPLLPRIQALPHLRYEYYEDVYHPGFQYLEIFDASASKYSASRYLAQSRGFTRIVAFGDNKNDLPLFAAADYKIAVENAVPALQACADELCFANTQNGVCRWLLAHAVCAPPAKTGTKEV